MSRKIRTLLFSSLYPSSARPGHGIFVETRLRQLLDSGVIETKVVAPVPWFFSKHARYGDYAAFAQTPRREVRYGIDVLHPRYAMLPKVGMNFSPFSMAIGGIKAVQQLQREGFDFDLIDAHYLYPDGVAAALVAKWLGKPLVVTARGSDINLISTFFIPRKLMLWAAEQASACIAVSKALSERMAGIGVARSKLRIFRNGVDANTFHLIPQARARSKLGWPELPTLISVGNLVENKGHHIAIELLQSLKAFRLVIVGSGPELAALERLVERLGVKSRVIFAGRVPHEELPVYYSAADMLVLPSIREGWPNVVLEAMACGTPVVASNVGGLPEIITTPLVGQITDDVSVAGFLSKVESLWASYPERAAVRAYAETFGWAQTTEAQIALFGAIKWADSATDKSVT